MREFLVVRPVVAAAVGVFDMKQKKYVFAGKKSALDVMDNFVAAERKNGELAIYVIGQKDPVAAIELPRSEFGRLRTVAFSDNGGWNRSARASPSGTASGIRRGAD